MVDPEEFIHLEHRLIFDFLAKARDRIIAEPDQKHPKLIENYESRLSQFLNEREYKYVLSKLKSKELLNGNLFKKLKSK